MTGSSIAGKRCVVLVVLVCLLAVLSGVLAAFALKTFRQREQARLFPANTEVYRAANEGIHRTRDQPDATRALRLVFFGDSRVQQWSPAPELRHAVAIWRGISGETTAQMALRFREDVIALSPDIVVIQAGINDIVAGSVLGLGKQSAVSAFRNLKDMVEGARKSGIRVLLLTVIQPSRPSLLRRVVWSNEIPELVDALNADLLSLSDNATQVLDVNRTLAPEGNPLQSRFAKDTLHLTDAGYVAINNLVQESIERMSGAVQ